MRALWTALEVPRHQGIELANLFTRIGSDAAAFKAGQDAVRVGQAGRVAPALSAAPRVSAPRSGVAASRGTRSDLP